MNMKCGVCDEVGEFGSAEERCVHWLMLGKIDLVVLRDFERSLEEPYS